MSKLSPRVEALRAGSTAIGGGVYSSSVRLHGVLAAGDPPPVAPEAPAEDAPPTVDDPDIFRSRFRFFSADTDLLGHDLRSPSAEVLQRRAGLWSHKIVRADHTDSVRDLIGQTGTAEWHDGRAEGDPGGVEGFIDFDRRLAGNVAIGLERAWLTDVSSVVEVDWEPSHPDLEPFTFWLLLGEEGPDGRTVTRQITDVRAVHGVDVVDTGADPHAQRVDASALQNNPRGEPPTTNPRGGNDMDLTRINEALGLPVESSIDIVLTAAAVAKADREALAGIYSSFSLTGDQCKPENVRAKALAQTADFVPRSEFAALQAQLRQSEVTGYIDSVIRLGKITPADRDFWAAAADKDLQAVRAHLDAKPKGSAVPLGVDAPPAKTDAEPSSVQLTATEQYMVDSLGLKPESIIAARKVLKK